MTSRTYDNIQGALTYAVLVSGFVALTFAIDLSDRVALGDLTAWGATYVPQIIAVSSIVFGLAVIAKAWGAWVHNKFWIKKDLADKLHLVAYRIDPRRK